MGAQEALRKGISPEKSAFVDFFSPIFVEA